MAKKKKRSNKIVYIILGLIVVLLIVAVVVSSNRTNEIVVELAKAQKTEIIEKVSASGMVQPVKEIKLSPDVAGEIIQLKVEEGDSVTAGDLLVKIRPDNWITALERAEASLSQQKANLSSSKANLSRTKASYDRAKADYARQKKLKEEQVISQADWELAEQNYKVAQNELKSAEQSVKAAEYIVKSSIASVKEAQENVRLTNVIAPASGIISKLIVEQGERVVGTQQMAGTEMLRIADLNKMEVRVDVNENDIIRVSIGDTATIDVDAYTYLEKEFRGIVTAIANTANDKVSADAVTEFEVRVRILNDSYADLIKEGKRFPFRPGMTASVDIITNRKQGILSVPLSSVTTRNPNDEKSGEEKSETDSENDSGEREEEEKEVVFVNKEGKVKMVEVKTGISDFDHIEILSGIKENEEVVSGPFLAISKRLKDGDAIKEKEDKKEE